jgi:hypothetical protein
MRWRTLPGRRWLDTICYDDAETVIVCMAPLAGEGHRSVELQALFLGSGASVSIAC